MAMAGELVSSRVSPERVNRSQGWNRSQNWLPAIFHQQINPETNALAPRSSYQRNRDDELPLRATSSKAAQTCGCSAAGTSKDTQILTLLSINSKLSKSLPKRWEIQVRVWVKGGNSSLPFFLSSAASSLFCFSNLIWIASHETLQHQAAKTLV